MLIFRDIYHFYPSVFDYSEVFLFSRTSLVSQLTHKTLISWLELFVLLRRSNI